MKLYHYTCSHAAPKIDADGELRPHPHPFFADQPPVVWLTDMAHPLGARTWAHIILPEA